MEFDEPSAEWKRQALAEMAEKYKQAETWSEAAPGRFLNTWKEAIKLSGKSHLFYCDCENIDAATDKEQLRPNYKAFDNSWGVLSTSEQVFLASLYSFYNELDAKEWLDDCSYYGVGSVSNRLDIDQVQIVTELMKWNIGW